MMMYILYRIGHAMAMVLPLRCAYGLACLLADIYCCIASNDRKAVRANIKLIFDYKVNDKNAGMMAKDVFRNFAKYLVDFFRFSRIDEGYIKKFVRVEGLQNLDAALSKGKGGILLSAHIGNWELGAAVVALLGYRLSAVVLTHQNEKINDFFTRQRLMGKVTPIEIGISLKACYSALKGKGLLALLGDRDFTKNGLSVDFFGKRALIPKGPAFFSCRIGSPIIPCFMVRETDHKFRLVFEEPILPAGGPKEDCIRDLMKKYIAVIETYIKRYPTQWYIFKDLWSTSPRQSNRNEAT